MAEACSAALQAPRASYLKSGSRRRGSNSRDKATGVANDQAHSPRDPDGHNGGPGHSSTGQGKDGNRWVFQYAVRATYNGH